MCWKSNRIRRFWRPFCSNCDLSWRNQLEHGACLCNQDTSSRTASFYKLMTSLIFFLSWLSLGQLLINSSHHWVVARSIKSLKNLICCKRNTVDTFHKKCYSDIAEIACKVGIEECKPRTSKLQRNYNNIPSESISDYFKKVVTIPLLDHLTDEIERRVDHASISVYSGLVIKNFVYLLIFQRWFSMSQSVEGRTGLMGHILVRK